MAWIRPAVISSSRCVITTPFMDGSVVGKPRKHLLQLGGADPFQGRQHGGGQAFARAEYVGNLMGQLVLWRSFPLGLLLVRLLYPLAIRFKLAQMSKDFPRIRQLDSPVVATD